LKKSEGMLKKMWQKRKCSIKDGIMGISHSDVSKETFGFPIQLLFDEYWPKNTF